jgi:predicted dehydrogenase
MTDVLRIGMVGCGEIAMENLKGIQDSGNSKITIAMDTNKNLAKSLAEQAQIKWTTDYEEVLTTPEVDAVFICTPHYLHASQGIKAAKAGKHVIVEKPMAITLKEAENLIQVCNTHQVKLTVPYVLRYEENILKVKQFIQMGAIGKIVAININWISDKPDSYWESGFTGRIKTDWRISKAKSGGGVLIMNCCHLFDYIEFITGLKPVKYISNYGTFLTNVEVEDYFFGILKYNNGALGNILAGSKMIGGRYPGEQRGVRFFGENGQVVISHPGYLQIYTEKNIKNLKAKSWNVIKTSNEEDTIDLKSTKENNRALFIREFTNAVLKDNEPPITGEIAYESLKTCLKLYENNKFY